MSRFMVAHGGGATVGQPDASPASGGTFSLRGGFWRQPVYRTAPAQVTGLRASNATGRLHLTWDDVTHNTNGNPLTGVAYRVYRATEDPYFTPAAPAYHDNITSPEFTDLDANALADTAHGYYYAVTAVDSDGRESEPSIRTATFAFPLAPGN
jgi:hypothetical protein